MTYLIWGQGWTIACTDCCCAGRNNNHGVTLASIMEPFVHLQHNAVLLHYILEGRNLSRASTVVDASIAEIFRVRSLSFHLLQTATRMHVTRMR